MQTALMSLVMVVIVVVTSTAQNIVSNVKNSFFGSGKTTSTTGLQKVGAQFAQTTDSQITPYTGTSAIPSPTPTQIPNSKIYYVSTTGNDNSDGLTQTTAWKTFARAFDQNKSAKVSRGDNLIILAGTYYESLTPRLAENTSVPVRIRTLPQDEGKVVIDGQGTRSAVTFHDYLNANYITVEGIVAKNSRGSVFNLDHVHHVELKRVSGYDAWKYTNDSVFSVWGNDNLIEDCIAAGTGRKMILIYSNKDGQGNRWGDRNIVRRCFAYVHQDNWRPTTDSALNDENPDPNIVAPYCGTAYPNSETVQVYNGTDNIMENVIVTGASPVWLLQIQANDVNATTANNKILGSISVGAGMDPKTGAPQVYDEAWGRDNSKNCSENFRDFAPQTWPFSRTGVALYGQGTLTNNLFQDVFSYGHAGLGFSYTRPMELGPSTGNVVRNMTIANSGIAKVNDPGNEGYQIVATRHTGLTIENTKVQGVSKYNGTGADLRYRYMNGQKTNESLWPWPMEERIKNEFSTHLSKYVSDYPAFANYSVTNTFYPVLEQHGAVGGGPLPTQPITATPTAVPSSAPTATPKPIGSKPRVNVPIYNVNSGDPKLDGNNRVTVWGGKVSTGDNYFDLRLIGSNSGLHTRVQFYDAIVADGDTFEIVVNGGSPIRVSKGNNNGATVGIRCTGTDCRGWDFSKVITWAELGTVKPKEGDTWTLKATYTDLDSSPATWDGELRWGEPSYEGFDLPGSQKLTLPLISDSNLGGSTDCGAPNYPDYFSTWGTQNWGNSPYGIVQNEWDTSDWPCYAKQVMAFQKPSLPANTTITKATVTVYHFGDPGYGDCYDIRDDGEYHGSLDTMHDIYELTDDFNENTVGWDTVGAPRENIGRTLIPPAREACSETNAEINPIAREIDVTELVKRAIAENRSNVNMLLYTGAGQYHSGKQFYTKEGAAKPIVNIYYSTQLPAPTAPAKTVPQRVNLPATIESEDYISAIGYIKTKANSNGVGKKIFSIAPLTSTTYNVKVNTAGRYYFAPRTSAKRLDYENENKMMRLELVIGGKTLVYTPTVTENWDIFVPLTAQYVDLAAGDYTLTVNYNPKVNGVQVKNYGFDIDNIMVTKDGAAVSPTTPVATVTVAPTSTTRPTSTIVPPTATSTKAPTNTPVPPTATNQPSPTSPPSLELDTFDANGQLSANWAGNKAYYSVSNGNLAMSGYDAVYWKTKYGVDQEVYYKIAKLDTAANNLDIRLVLKSQSLTNSNNLISVSYISSSKNFEIWTRLAGKWSRVAKSTTAELVNNDVFKAQSLANGTVIVYKNSIPVLTANIKTLWNKYNLDGYIGIWASNAGTTTIDNFGGGNLGIITPSPTSTTRPTSTILPPTATSTKAPTNTPVPPTSTPTKTPTAAPTSLLLDSFDSANSVPGVNWSGNKVGYYISNSNLVAASAYDAIFWQKEKFGANQEAYIKLTAIDTGATSADIGLVMKTQSVSSNSTLLLVSYLPATKIVEVWHRNNGEWSRKISAGNIQFVNGDIFGAKTNSSGDVVVSKNNTPIVTVNISQNWPLSANDGWIGLWMSNVGSSVFDDFGGGTVSGGVPGATSTPVPTVTLGQPTPTSGVPTATPTNGPTKAPTSTPVPGIEETIYMAPANSPTNPGRDTNNGLSRNAPIATFSKAWNLLSAGDTLVLLDGVYTEAMVPRYPGAPGRPITIKAENDGGAIIDGQYRHIPIEFTNYIFPNKEAYYVIEGFTVRNGVDIGINLGASHITVRRVHAYNLYHPWEEAQGKDLEHPLWSGANTDILIEDSVFSGVSKKLLKIWMAQNTTIRRVLVDWRWNGAHTDHNMWPWSGGVNVYYASNSIVENAISVGNSADYGINFHGSELSTDNKPVSDNKYLGSIILNTGMTKYGTKYQFGSMRPQPMLVEGTSPTFVLNTFSPGWGSGLNIGGGSNNNIFKDIVATGNSDVGINITNVTTATASNNTVSNVTLFNNGLAPTFNQTAPGQDFALTTSGYTVVDSDIEGTQYQGTGADITKKYVDGEKTNDPLWPWPMEERIRTELGYSITNMVAKALKKGNAKIANQVSEIPDIPRPILQTDITAVEFGNKTVNSSTVKEVVLTNGGNGDMIISNINIINEVASVFSAANGTSSCATSGQFTLVPGSSCKIYVQFVPKADTYYTGRLLIYPGNIGTVAHPQIVALVGKGPTSYLSASSNKTDLQTVSASVSEVEAPVVVAKPVVPKSSNWFESILKMLGLKK